MFASTDVPLQIVDESDRQTDGSVDGYHRCILYFLLPSFRRTDWDTGSEFHWPRFKEVFGKHDHEHPYFGMVLVVLCGEEDLAVIDRIQRT